jgi:hypothetical protein
MNKAALSDESLSNALSPGLDVALSFPLLAALGGRRARRFSVGATIPDGPLAFASPREPLPLTELEQLLLLCAVAGNTGWHYAITRNARYAPHFSNYAGAAGGRTYPSAAGFHTSELFYTDDDGVYHFPTRDLPALVERSSDGAVDFTALLEAHRPLIRKLSDGRLDLPRAEPHIEGHNTWCVNVPGSTLLIPVGDLAQHHVLVLCYLTQNGYCIFDDVHRQAIPGIERFAHLVAVDDPYPLSFVEQLSLTELTVELATACYAGALVLQAMGLGGWMFDGINPLSILGASADEGVRGLGFRFDQDDDRRPLPNPTGLAGVFEGHCPPHFPDMRAAVEAVARRKFGPGGPFNADTPGPWKQSARVRGAAEVHSEEFKECVALQAQYVFDRFGKFPGTVPSVHVLMYLQAHHLDLDFYDAHFSAGAYLDTHADHVERWHQPS